MARIAEATARLFGRVFVCRKCKSKQRADPTKVRARKITCRKCNCRNFRPKTKEKRVGK